MVEDLEPDFFPELDVIPELVEVVEVAEGIT